MRTKDCVRTGEEDEDALYEDALFALSIKLLVFVSFLTHKFPEG